MARRSRAAVARQPSPPRALVLDSEGLGKAADGDPRVRAYVTRARELDAEIVVSTLTLTETLRGKPKDAHIHRFLKSVRREPVNEALAREAGQLLGQTGRSDTVDAIVVVTACSLGIPVFILTSDPDDLTDLTEAEKQIQVLHV